MPRKPKDIRECIHYWSHQVVPQARCGNVSFNGPVLYSYAEPIGLLLPGNRVLLSDRNFSITTSSHQSAASGAVSHMKHCHAPHLVRYYNSETDLFLMHNYNRDYWERQAENALVDLKHHPRRKKSVSDRIASAVSSYNAYREFFSLDWPELTSDEMRTLVEERAVERVEKEKLRAERQRIAQEFREKEEAEELELWREHKTERWSFSKMALRLSLDGTEIETSRGARVPVSCAAQLWKLATRAIKNKQGFKPPERYRVGVYSLDQVDANGWLLIGCHTIPFDELVLMAKKLKFIEGDSNGIESDRIEVDGSIRGAGEQAGTGEHRSAA